MFPDKRSLENPNAIWYKLNAESRRKEGEKWRLFELNGERSITSAIRTLEKAWSQAVTGPTG
jgi:hypothetical protein